MSNALEILEFEKIREQLLSYAATQAAKEKIRELKPHLQEVLLRGALHETSDARTMLDFAGTPPLPDTEAVCSALMLAEKGGLLLPAQLLSVAAFSAACKRLKAYLKKSESTGVSLAFWGEVIDPLEELTLEIHRCITGSEVDSNATKNLRDIRRQMETTREQIKTRMEELLKSHKKLCTDSFVSVKNGHYTLPVSKNYKNQISGTVIATSSAGSTCFIEPTAIRKYTDKLAVLETEEAIEIDKILYTLSVLVAENHTALRLNAETVEKLDFAFAKGKMSLETDARAPQISTDRHMKIVQGRHPLLNRDVCVPVDFEIGQERHGETIRGVVITGPNTGGKTVTLKLVGLFSVMAQCGLHLPCESAEICMNGNVLCDIGDRQDISQNLSTFSAHITNVIDILNDTARDSLVLLDELGSGTDPAEGMGIAVSILEELRRRGCLFLATTHYAEVKQYAEEAEGILNARMTFDRKTLRPEYKLVIGEAGESCAFYIARRLGYPPHLLEYAEKVTYGRQSTPKTELRFEPLTDTPAPARKKSRVEKAPEKKTIPQHALQFEMGDSVFVYPGKKIGIVYKPADETGVLVVQVQGKKYRVKHNRLKLQTKAAELYPADYDFSIIFDTV
ncbi:MAG: DNA mismatch repair protein MutS, partial [Clostridia bacterium]|nr:DNA mismatch repair protein MutS [Clostridia bacterium]